jgi:hypothetical protein
MKYKKVLIVLCAVLFFLAALTSYINRVVFPRLVKKIAVERIEEVLKRKVEIGSIHFNWIRGFVIDKIKIYEKAPHDAVFAQADQVSFGIIFFPGSKRYRITIPFINVRSPSVHLIRTGIDTWNFSDMCAPRSATASSWEIAWGGITISDGKFLVDDVSTPQPWSEFFDNINLNLSLSYKGISYDFTADIPAKKGFIGAIVYYQPVTQNTQAQIHLKNIDTASYLSLINIPDVHLDSGVIKEVRLNINHAQGKTFVQGDAFIKDLDVTSHEQSFKGDIEIRGLDAQYQSGNLSARGQMTLNNVQAAAPGFSAGGSAQARVNDFELTREGATFLGSLHAQNIFMDLEDRQVQADEVVLDNIKIRKDKDGIQSVGSIMTKGLLVQWPDQKVQGNITLKAMTLRMKDEDDIALEGDLQADHFSASIDDKNISSQRVLLENIRLSILDQENVTLNTKLSLDDVTITAGKNILVSAASIKTDKLFFNLDDDIIKVSAILNSSKGKMVLDDHKTIEADPRLELTLQMSLSAPEELVYKGSITFSDARILGFAPIPSLDNVELDADFQNDEATINALSANILDTNVRVNGTVKNFENPILNITAEADELNLAKIKDLVPQMVDQYGLTFDGTGSVKVRFIGLATSPLTGDILVTASVKNGSVSSSPFHQRIKNITGIVEATADSLKWRDFSAVYAGQKYALAGSVDDFKNPKILTTIDGPNFRIKADIAKNKDLFTINAPMVRLMGYSLTDMKINIDQGEGKVKNLTFDGKLYDGTVHAVGSLDLTAKGIGYDLALNIDNTDMHKWKIDSPLKMDEIDGKFFLTALAHGTVADFKNNLHATGSLAIRDGFLAEFNLFKGLLSVLNDALRLGQVEITDVESNFTISDQKINTDNLRLKGPTIVLLGKGWVNFDGICDLHVTVDLSSGSVPAVAHNVLDTLNIHIYDKVTNPKFKRKISMPQVINSLLKNLLQ